MFRSRTVASAFAAICVCASAQASPVLITGDIAASAEQTGANFTGSVEYVFDSGSTGYLTIELENTSGAVVGGFLTAVIFRFDTVDTNASVLLTSSTRPAMINTGEVTGQPFGSFMGGAGIGGDFQGGGPAAGGIAVGSSATFNFTITASDASALTSMDFVSGDNMPQMLVRFRGLNDGGSDKVPTVLVPAPASMALAGLAGLVATRRRRD